MLTYLTLFLFILVLMVSHEGVGTGQKSRFHLLRDKLNERKKSGDTVLGTSVAPHAKVGAGVRSPRPPPSVEKKKKGCPKGWEFVT